MNIIIGGNGYVGSFLLFKYRTSLNVISDNDNKNNGIKYSDFIENYNNLDENCNIFICSSYSKNYNIINDLKENSKNKTFILFSSAVIYDGNEKSSYEETDIGNSNDQYSKTVKLNEEKFMKLEGRKIIIRLGTLYGFSPFLCATRGIQRMIFSSLINNELIIDKPELKKSMVSLEDLYNAIDIILNNPKDNEIYNISSFSTTIGELGTRISETFNIPIKYISSNKVNYNFILNCDKLKSLGWNPKSNINTIFNDINDNIHLCKEIKYNDGIKDIIIWYVKDTCRVCNSKKLFKILDLNNQVSPNRLNDKFWKFIKFPLHLYGCNDCYHLQLYGVMNPIIMYKNYTYLSGTADTMRQYFSDLVDKIEILRRRRRGSEESGERSKNEINGTKSVLDIACNDGALLDYFYKKGYETYGIDPAENIVKNIKNHNIYCGFFNEQSINYFNKKFDVITALNVFAHVDDIYNFFHNLDKISTPETDVYIQTSQCDMIQNNEFDTIYHEHLSFFNMNSIIKTSKKSNFYLYNVEIVPVHGNSYLFHFKQKTNHNLTNYNIFNRFEYEIYTNIYSRDTYNKYANNIYNWKNNLIDIIIDNQDKIIICCGASAKGITILQYLYDDFINKQLKIHYFIDENKLKINNKIDSIDVIIKSFDFIKDINKPILFILTAWNFKEEIMKKVKDIRNNTEDKFLNLFPLSIF